MRDHFDPLAPLQLHQNQNYYPDPHHGSHMQAFGNGFSSSAGFSAGSSVGEKRNNSDENVDCNLLQSSLKRVRLSRSPGEFRLQRDLKTLNPMQWASTQAAANALNFSPTTWIHRPSGTCLTMVDSLRICLFLPVTAMPQNGQYPTGLNPQQQYQHQILSYHRDYRWRIMIQFPRMYPHNPPVVTRIEGLSIDSIVINELPPDARHQSNRSTSSKGKNESDETSSVQSTPAVTASESLFFTEAQLARPQSSSRTSTGTQNTASLLSMGGGSGKKIEWNQWSPITGLGELLDFLLGAAASNPSTTTMNTAMTTTAIAMMGGMKNDLERSMAVTTARMSSSSSSSLSSVSSSSSISSWGNRNPSNHDHGRSVSFMHRSGNNTVTETMMTDENATTSSNRTNLSGESFLSPNRFDVGYGKSGIAHRSIAAAGTTPRTTNTSAWQQHMQCRGKQGDDDVGMDMS